MHNKLETLMGEAGGFIHDNPIKVILSGFATPSISHIAPTTNQNGYIHRGVYA